MKRLHPPQSKIMSNKAVQRNFVVSAPRQALESHYRLDGLVPFEVGEKLFAKQSSMVSDLEHQEQAVEKKILQTFLQDGRIRPGTKEKVSKAVLRGDYEVQPERTARGIPPVQPHAAIRDAERRAHQLLLLNRHSLPKPHFLELASESTTIPMVSQRLVREEQLRRLRRERALREVPDTSMVLESISGSTFSAEPMVHEPRTTQAQQAKSMSSQLMLADKKRKLAAWREQILSERNAIKQVKESAQHALMHRVDVKKQLSSIRGQIKKYLVAKRHPMRGEIIRCIDESMVYHLVEKYEGLTMSAEAILALIGNAIGTAILTPEIDTQEEQQHLQASQSNELSHCSMINNYRSFGRRAPSPKAAMSGYDQIMSHSGLPDHQDSRMTLEDHFKAVVPPIMRQYDHPAVPFHTGTGTFHTGTGTFHTGTGTFHTGTGAATYVTPRAVSPDKTVGAGFRLHTPHETPQTPSSAQRLVLMSSEHLKRVSSEMFGAAPLEEEPSQVPSVSVGDAYCTEAITVMHEQLLEEELLPSMRPARVLTGDQITALGNKARTWDDIFREVTSASGNRPVSVPAPVADSSNASVEDMIESELHHSLQGRPPSTSKAARPMFFGSLAQRAADRERMEGLISDEQRAAEGRLILPSLRPPSNNDPSPLAMLTMDPAAFAAMNEGLARGPRSIKSREGPVALGPKSPYGSWAEEMSVLNNGLPSGAGLRLYRPTATASPTGRYRASHGQHTAKGVAGQHTVKARPYVPAV